MPQIRSEEITLVSVNELIPYSKNMNIHTDEQIDRLCKLIEFQGFRDPLIVQRGTNVIAAGHGRWVSAKKLGMEKVPVTYQEFENEAQFYAFVVSHNAVAKDSWASLDLGKVNSEMLDLGPDFDIDLLGIKDFVIEPAEKFEPQADEDAVPEVEHPITRRGDIWLLGNHRVMCGDSTMIDDVEKLLNGKTPNLMVTDPPYGVKYEAGWRAEAKGSKKTEREESSNLQNDDRSDWYDSYSLFSGDVVYVWHASAFTDVVMNNIKDCGFNIKAQIIWNKNIHALSRSDYHWKHEPCWYAIRDGKNHSWVGDRKQMTIWDVKSVIHEKDAGGKTSHPTQKPIELYVKSIENHTKRDEYIYEPFGGSGSSVIAAEKTGRRSLTVELDEKYCDVIIKRWEEYTGNKATLESTGQTYLELKEERDGQTS